ncbi:hypothetical protein [Gordonia sihwensis]|uniref:hypothetical protein n=1 Tax=Gordonia sihwensis TaxID=173559 RepID=UPI0005EF6084|nr:hypothetical protein [Gordonia sihwensis]KJR10292.1 hypothetical protein UG54_01570 [Gordonia sihwensis]
MSTPTAPENQPSGPILALEGTGIYTSPFGKGFYVLVDRIHRCQDGHPVYFRTNAEALAELGYAFEKAGKIDYRTNGVIEPLAVPFQADPVTGVCTWATLDAWNPGGDIVVRYIVIVRGKFHIKDNAFHTYSDYAEAVADLAYAATKVGRSKFRDYVESCPGRVPQPMPTPHAKPA